MKHNETMTVSVKIPIKVFAGLAKLMKEFDPNEPVTRSSVVSQSLIILHNWMMDKGHLNKILTVEDAVIVLSEVGITVPTNSRAAQQIIKLLQDEAIEHAFDSVDDDFTTLLTKP